MHRESEAQEAGKSGDCIQAVVTASVGQQEQNCLTSEGGVSQEVSCSLRRQSLLSSGQHRNAEAGSRKLPSQQRPFRPFTSRKGYNGQVRAETRMPVGDYPDPFRSGPWTFAFLHTLPLYP